MQIDMTYSEIELIGQWKTLTLLNKLQDLTIEELHRLLDREELLNLRQQPET